MKAKTWDKIATAVLYAISFLIIFLLVGFIGYIIYNGRSSLNLHFLIGDSLVNEAGGGIGPQLFNSFYMLIISLVITVPIGIGAGIYLSQYAKQGKVLGFIRLCIETISSLPSIVVGLFGLLVFVTMTHWQYTLLAGALAITVINLPSMTRVSENAITAVASKVREASLGLGATEWQTIKKVILPSAMPQILTGVILAAGRVFGEAAALLYTSGMSSPNLNYNNISLTNKISPFSLFRPAETLAVHIWKLNSESMIPDASKIANGSSAVLVIMVLLFNFLARIIGNKIYKAYSGK
jgi:phosphate transport system permease protein